MARVPSLKNFSADQLDKLINQAKKEKAKIEKGAGALVKKVESLLKEHGLSFDDLVGHFSEKSKKPARKKKRRTKATAKKATTRKTRAKKASAKAASPEPAAKKATRKKATRKKKVTRKVAPKYRNPKDADQLWTGRGRKPKWVEAELAAGKTMDDLKI